jgi:hypothetical protein
MAWKDGRLSGEVNHDVRQASIVCTTQGRRCVGESFVVRLHFFGRLRKEFILREIMKIGIHHDVLVGKNSQFSRLCEITTLFSIIFLTQRKVGVRRKMENEKQLVQSTPAFLLLSLLCMVLLYF